MAPIYIPVGGAAMAIRTKATRARSAAPLDGPSFARATKAATDKDQPVTLFAVDLDDLHTLNVEAGHDAGDRFIAAAAKAMTAAGAREHWTIGRIGGDEFPGLLAGVRRRQGFLKADFLRGGVGPAPRTARPQPPCNPA